MQAQQRELLDAAVLRIAPGGLLIYSVCSWLPEEAVMQRGALILDHPELEPAAIWPEKFGHGGLFRPDPLAWEGEGFQAFALRRR